MTTGRSAPPPAIPLTPLAPTPCTATTGDGGAGSWPPHPSKSSRVQPFAWSTRLSPPSPPPPPSACADGFLFQRATDPNPLPPAPPLPPVIGERGGLPLTAAAEGEGAARTCRLLLLDGVFDSGTGVTGARPHSPPPREAGRTPAGLASGGGLLPGPPTLLLLHVLAEAFTPPSPAPAAAVATPCLRAVGVRAVGVRAVGPTGPVVSLLGLGVLGVLADGASPQARLRGAADGDGGGPLGLSAVITD